MLTGLESNGKSVATLRSIQVYVEQKAFLACIIKLCVPTSQHLLVLYQIQNNYFTRFTRFVPIPNTYWLQCRSKFKKPAFSSAPNSKYVPALDLLQHQNTCFSSVPTSKNLFQLCSDIKISDTIQFKHQNNGSTSILASKYLFHATELQLQCKKMNTRLL